MLNHHATLYRVDSVSLFNLQFDDVNCEIYEHNCPKFGIDDARKLVIEAHTRPQQKNEQILLVKTNFITHEAQNALLKILEEPPIATKLVFVVPSNLTLLSTLLSRFNESVISLCSEKGFVFSNFLDSSYKDRIAVIEQITKKQDAEWQQQFKDGLIEYVSGLSINSKIFLEECEYVARQLLTRGASNKMLLEHIALILPIREK